MAQFVRRARENDICVFIGRFQPLHAGHMGVILKALEAAEFVVLIVGSAFQFRRPDVNPFTFAEREAMIRASLPPEAQERVIIIPIADSNYNKDQWNEDVYKAVNDVAASIKADSKISLIGHSKDKSSFYLKEFQNWGAIDVVSSRPLDATSIRNSFLNSNIGVVENMFQQAIDRQDLSVGVINWLRDFQKQDTYLELIDEMEYYRSCHALWARESWPGSRNTVCADVLIEQDNHVLLVRRNEYPQKGSWATPGGHLNTDETVQECGLREGYEETGIKVPKIIFERSLVGKEEFDEPRRDPRGRYITTMFHYKLQPQVPEYDTTKTPEANRARVLSALARPKVTGMDDAAEAKWWHWSDITREMMFLDCFAMIHKMRAKNQKGDQ